MTLLLEGTVHQGLMFNIVNNSMQKLHLNRPPLCNHMSEILSCTPIPTESCLMGITYTEFDTFIKQETFVLNIQIKKYYAYTMSLRNYF